MRTLMQRTVELARWTLRTRTRQVSSLLIVLAVSVAVVLISRASTTRSQEQVLIAWATATQQGDYATAERAMPQDLTRLLWQDRTAFFARQGRLGMFHIVSERWAGTSLTATLYWHAHMDTPALPGSTVTGPDRSTEPLCLQVQVGRDGTIRPLTDYHACQPEELQ